MYTTYIHHGKSVVVRKDLKGQHRQHCMCYDCALFTPEDREENCEIANAVYENAVKFGIVTPVWECPSSKFLERLEDEDDDETDDEDFEPEDIAA